MHRSHALLTLILGVALAASAAAQSAPPADRVGASPLGKVTMPREAAPDANGATAVVADLVLNVSVARDAGARYILVSVGNDANTALVIDPGEMTSASGGVQADRVENAGTYRVQWWWDVPGLNVDKLEFRFTATATAGNVTTDVEVLAMAFDANYAAVSTSGGKPLTVQSFTTVKADGRAPAPPTTPTPDPNFEGPGDDPPVDPSAGDDPVPKVDDPPKKKRVPAASAVLLASVLAGVALALRRR